MNIAFASSECVPFAKTGGLGDVVGILPKELKKLGHDVKVFIPNYSHIEHAKYWINYQHHIGGMPIRVNGTVHNVHVHMAHLPNSQVEIYFIDYPDYFHRGTLYTEGPDEDERFILFQKAVMETIQRLQWKPDIIHAHDWQAGLLPLYVEDNYAWDKLFDKTATVMTIHNIGYQGRFPKETLYKAEIRESLHFENGPVEVWGGDVSFLKTGLMFADMINTVSETYAAETTTYEYGEGLDGVLKYRINDYYGILNGVDYAVWNPENDQNLPFNYSIKDMSGKTKTKQYLLKELNLQYDEHVPLIGIISRMVSQKGFDLIQQVAAELMEFNAQWVILGSGEAQYEDFFRRLAYSFPEKVHTYIGYNDELAHLIEAAADIFLMPSRYEPCGLNQLYSLRYGTVPVVRKTGGLADTVLDWDEEKARGRETGTGFSFYDYTGFALKKSVERAIDTFAHKKTWNTIIKNGMEKDYSWHASAEKYAELYEQAYKKKNG